jgi:hypothetical protein
MMMTFVLLSLLATSAKAFTSTPAIRSFSGGVGVVASTARRSSPPMGVLYASVANQQTTTNSQVYGSTGVSKKSDRISKEEVRALFGLWNDALATGDSRVVASRYAQGATLLPTVRSFVSVGFFHL